MKIVKLVAENIKGLKAIEIVPDENLQIISGKNGQGKTSIMDAIWLALAGGNASKSMSRPMRDGTDSAFAELDMGDFVVTRKWSSNEKSTLQVISKEGAKFSSPQKLLDEMIGKLSFDPLAFSNLATKDQLKTLLEIVNIDPSSLEANKKKVFEERTMINREVKGLSAQLESLHSYSDDVPEEEIQASQILTEMQAAQTQLHENNILRSSLDKFRDNYNGLKDQLEQMNSNILKTEKYVLQLKNQRDEAQKEILKAHQEGLEKSHAVQALVDPDLSSYNKQLSQVEEVNKQVRGKRQVKEVIEKYESKLKESDILTEQIKEIEEQKQSIMKEAKFPIEGLSFDESGVLYFGVPFSQCSSAERLKISTAMAMALNPKLRVIRIMDGSLLDSTNLKMIQDMAKEKDFQIWVEQVDESGKVGIVIEDGEVKQIEPIEEKQVEPIEEVSTMKDDW